jgi:hypothetical protein
MILIGTDSEFFGVTVRYKSVTEIGSLLYVRAAALIDELYRSCPPLEPLWLDERRRHHKRLWMRLMRSDIVSARRTLALLTSDYARAPFEQAYQARLDDEIIFALFFLIEENVFPFDTEDDNDARKIVKTAEQCFENPVASSSPVSAAA